MKLKAQRNLFPALFLFTGCDFKIVMAPAFVLLSASLRRPLVLFVHYQQGNKATRQQGSKATRQQGNKGNKAIRCNGK